LLELIERNRQAGAAFRSPGDLLVDTSSAQGQVLATTLAATAQLERSLIAECTGDGRKRSIANGVKFVRKPKLSDYQRKKL
jgi:DNA invertase Pin-like site-specific DNA recombinase